MEGKTQTNWVPVPEVGAGVGRAMIDTDPDGMTGGATLTKSNCAGTVSVIVTLEAAPKGTWTPML